MNEIILDPAVACIKTMLSVLYMDNCMLYPGVPRLCSNKQLCIPAHSAPVIIPLPKLLNMHLCPEWVLHAWVGQIRDKCFLLFFFLVDRVVLSSYFPHSHLIIKIVFLKLDSRRIYWLESALTSDTKMNF